MFFNSFYWCDVPHTYTLAATGMKFKSKVYASRQVATNNMYDMVYNKYHTCIVKVYDDKHDKTYICANGVRFYITRN